MKTFAILKISIEDETDPLNFGVQIHEITPKPRAEPKVRIISTSVNPSNTDIFEEAQEQTKRRKSFKSLLKSTRQSQAIKKTDELPPSFRNPFASQSFTSIPKYDDSLIANDDPTEFDEFVIKSSLPRKNESLSATQIDARRKVWKVQLDAISKLLKKLQGRQREEIMKRSEELTKAEEYKTNFHVLNRMGIDKMREKAAMIIICQQKRSKIHKYESRRYSRLIERTVKFKEFLMSLEAKIHTFPSCDIEKFEDSLEKTSPEVAKLQRKIDCLTAQFTKHPIKPMKPEAGDFIFQLLHPQTKSGQIIKRFEDRVSSLNYDDVFAIIEHLDTENKHFSEIEQLLFDLAWQKHPFPFGFVREASLPSINDLFPAVFGTKLIDHEYAFTPFSMLNGMNWHFKSAIDMIFDMMILTNPFDIARKFWDVIQETAKCMQKVLVVVGGMRSEDVEIDFDSLFPILMICIFSFGQNEWMQVALYTMSFNEQVSDEPQLQFAMTYLEGLVTHIMALDMASLKKKAVEMRQQWADEQNDPLGLNI